jgi:hypothetical protein
MKNVAFILRGCPGLGRFVGTFEISKILNDSGQYNLFYVTYLEGSSYLKKKGVEHLEISNRYDLTPLGIQPISLSAEKIFDFIQENKIDALIMDGEPLLAISLKIEFPSIFLIAVLNPSDIVNSKIRPSITKFFNYCYNHTDLKIVHGLHLVPVIPNQYSLSTILRREVLDLDTRHENNCISVVFGGGTTNSTPEFYNSSFHFLENILNTAELLPSIRFEIFWPGYNQKYSSKVLLNNVELFNSHESPKQIYKNEIIIARAGRNTISEILYLNKKAILFAICGEHRNSEQVKNAAYAARNAQGRIRFLETYSIEEIIESIHILKHLSHINYNWEPGNNQLAELLQTITAKRFNI